MRWLISDEYADLPAKYSAVTVTAEDHKLLKANERNVLEFQEKALVINVRGVLTPKPCVICAIFGMENTSYEEIIEAVELAKNDSSITKVVLEVNSPGGHVAGIYEVMESLRSLDKPVETRVGGLAASAAFMIASQADTIIAKNKASQIGSFGVVVDYYDDQREKSITNRKSQDKRPDLSTNEGKAVYQDHLDEIYDLLAEQVANGRGLSIEEVNANFGQGRVFLATEALRRKMIDSIDQGSSSQNSIFSNNKKGIEKMNLDNLKKEHAALFDEVVELGVSQERDRVLAHLKMGEASGDMATAINAIDSGEDMTQSLQATYLAASMRQKSLEAVQDDSDEINVGDAAVSATEEAGEEAVVHNKVFQMLGFNTEKNEVK